MARVSRVRHTAKVAKVSTTGYGRTTYRARKKQSTGRYAEPKLIGYGRTFQEQTHGCPQPLNSPETGHYPSVAIAGIDYNNSLGRMTVTFVGGGTYSYEGVSQQRYQAFCNAGSKGRYMNKAIKGGYGYTRIG